MPDRSPQCDNCGQKFNYGAETSALPGLSGPEAPAAPAVVPPLPTIAGAVPVSGLSESIFELSRSVAGSKGDTVPVGAEPSGSGSARQGTRTHVVRDEDDRAELDMAVGTVLSGRLELVADLGGGPLGRVFKAIDRKKGSVVAVKAIPASRLPAEALAGRFAELVGQLKSLVHPNLVKVHGAGREGETAFVIMQYLEGLPLRALLDVKRENGGTFTFEEAEPIVVQICQGLQFAHGLPAGTSELVHGALKPENVFVQVDSLKLIDVGFARLFSPAEWWVSQRRGGRATPHLAPEFAADRPVIDRRADLYAVGALLYEMLTGSSPSGPDAPPVSALNPSVPRAVDRLVTKALAADPADRYESAAELKEAVLRVLGGDILAEDLESPPIAESSARAPDDGGIEIAYLGPAAGLDAPDASTRTSLRRGAIELHEPLWNVTELAGTSRRLHEVSQDGEPTPAVPPPAHLSLDLAEPSATPAGFRPAPPVASAIVDRPTRDDAEMRLKAEYPDRRSRAPIPAPERISGSRQRVDDADPTNPAAEPRWVSGVKVSADVPSSDLPTDPPQNRRPTLRGLDAAAVAARVQPAPRRSGGIGIALKVAAVVVVAGGGWVGYRQATRLGFVPSRTAALVCPEGMVALPRGRFPIGSEREDPDRDIWEPILHPVDVAGFCIDRYEHPNVKGVLPTTGVTSAEAARACEAVGKRLCSEREWERACKGLDGSRFPYGNAFQAGICNLATGDAPGRSMAIGAFPRCGALDGPFDLSGNVWEITASAWDDQPAARVIKGGSAKLPAWGGRCAYRDLLGPDQGTDDVGFRCCLTP